MNIISHYNDTMSLTVIKLKQIVESWPEFDEYGGPTEVYILNDDLTSKPVTKLSPLNLRTRGHKSADILLS